MSNPSPEALAQPLSLLFSEIVSEIHLNDKDFLCIQFSGARYCFQSDKFLSLLSSVKVNVKHMEKTRKNVMRPPRRTNSQLECGFAAFFF